ncbi:hypothetical protein OSB04_016233 [Centaurea solstitialis]|uniref:Uncharacterized protein n=1 Tax=Centaurea solstitialis TaxID=347529 RepID=A0AA38TKJ8_9ASTR|nr:hypothetical protein OSB04_016233 [Centaurea solstitialis]
MGVALRRYLDFRLAFGSVRVQVTGMSVYGHAVGFEIEILARRTKSFKIIDMQRDVFSIICDVDLGKRKAAPKTITSAKQPKRLRRETPKQEKESVKKKAHFKKDAKSKLKKPPTKKQETSRESKKVGNTTGIKLRTTPSPLFSAIRSLSIAQEECLKDMGFGGLLGMKLDGIPSNLGFYVAKNFNPENMTLNTSSGPIHINREAIHDMIGAPMGHLNFDDRATDDHGATIKRDWMMQFKKEPNEPIRPTDVIKQLLLSDDADWNFKVNFIVVFCNTMGECKCNGLCDLKETRFQDINWCDYILDCLRFCKNTWSAHDKNTFFCRPLTTLVLLYVDNIKCAIPRVIRQRPAIKSWSLDLLRVRVEIEIESGGLGMGEMKEPYQENLHVNCGAENMINIPPSSPSDIEGYLRILDETYNTVWSMKKTFDTTLMKGVN